MTEPKLKADKEAGNLSETTKTFLMEVFIQQKYGRKKDISNKYIEKGLLVENDAIKLYSRYKFNEYQKNEELFKNDFLVGTPDIVSDDIIDIKSSWDIFTFFSNLNKDVDSAYYWQLQAYLALTGKESAKLAYCLVNTPEMLVNDEKRKLMYKMNVATDENPIYLQACDELDRNMNFDDIPNRVIEFEVKRNDEDIQKMYFKIKKARIYLTELETQLENL
jgi:hypothetical protein